jgi:glycosyltransferase involved in cell wall biosynthesis
MPRILHIIPSLSRQGMAKQLRLVADGSAGAGDDVHVCVLAGAPRAYAWCANLEERGVNATILMHRAQCDTSCLPALCGLARSLRPDIVQTWLSAGSLFGRIAARAAGVKHIVSSLGERDLFVPRWQALAERRLGAPTQTAVVDNSAAGELAVRRGWDARHVRVIRPAVEPAAASRYSRGEIFKQLNLPQDARLLGTAGSLEREKNLKHLIWVTDIFQAIHEPVHFLIMGDGPQRARLELFARQIAVRSRVHFLGHRDDVLDVLPHLDVYVSGARHEGSSNGLLEAMAAGVPPVATDLAGHREFICHGQNGFLVPVGSRADVAKCVKKLLDSVHLAEAVGDCARDSVLASHSVADAVKQYRALYQSIASSAN